MKKVKHIMKYQLYTNASKKSMIIGCNIWMICLELNKFFTIRAGYCNFLNLYGRYILRVLTIYFLIDATDRSKITNNHPQISFDVSPYISFFANTPFNKRNLFFFSTFMVPFIIQLLFFAKSFCKTFLIHPSHRFNYKVLSVMLSGVYRR